MSMLAAVTRMRLGTLPNDALSAANNALSGFGKIECSNLAYESLLSAELISEDGIPRDLESLSLAIHVEITDRLEAGTFT